MKNNLDLPLSKSLSSRTSLLGGLEASRLVLAADRQAKRDLLVGGLAGLLVTVGVALGALLGNDESSTLSVPSLLQPVGVVHNVVPTVVHVDGVGVVENDVVAAVGAIVTVPDVEVGVVGDAVVQDGRVTVASVVPSVATVRVVPAVVPAVKVMGVNVGSLVKAQVV